MKKDSFNLVVRFLREHNFLLPDKDLPNWRLVPSGTYTHKTLPYGAMRHGITNGVVAYMCTTMKRTTRNRELHMDITVDMDLVVEVHLSNMEFVEDKFNDKAPRKRKAPNDKPKRVKKAKYDDDCLI